MSTLRLTPDQKFGRHMLSAVLSVFGTAIAALGLYGVYSAIKDYSADPRLFPAALFVTVIGTGVLWLAVSLHRETNRAETRTY